MPIRDETHPITELLPPGEGFAPWTATREAASQIAKTFFRAVHRPEEFAEDWVERPEVYLTPVQLLLTGASFLAAVWYARDYVVHGPAQALAAPGQALALLTQLAQPLFAVVVVLSAVAGLAIAGRLCALKRSSLANATRVYAMNTAMAVLVVPGIALLDVVGHHYGTSAMLALAVPKIGLWYLQLRHLAHAFQLFYGLPYNRAGRAVATHIAATGAIFGLALWGYALLVDALASAGPIAMS